jgi:hypothetical protein
MNVFAVDCHDHYSAALVGEGKLYVWGDTWVGGSDFSQQPAALRYPTYLRIHSNDVQFDQLSCGKFHIALRSKEGEAFTYSWGRGVNSEDFGQRGRKDIDKGVEGLLVPELQNKQVVRVQCGDYFTFIVGVLKNKEIKQNSVPLAANCEKHVDDKSSNPITVHGSNVKEATQKAPVPSSFVMNGPTPFQLQQPNTTASGIPLIKSELQQPDVSNPLEIENISLKRQVMELVQQITCLQSEAKSFKEEHNVSISALKVKTYTNAHLLFSHVLNSCCSISRLIGLRYASH